LSSCLRIEADWGQLPFVFLSSLSNPEEIRRGKSTGCDDYLTKPFHPDDLIAVIEGKLSTSQSRRKFSEAKSSYYRKKIIQTLSHEFRTPLSAVQGGIDLLKLTEESKSEKVQKLLKSMERGSARLGKLVDDFIVLQQIEDGQASLYAEKHSKKIQPISLIRDAVADLEIEDQVSVERSLNQVSKVKVCERQIVDALSRILSNAQKFGAGSEKTIAWVGDNPLGFVSILVRDFGPGMSDQDLLMAREVFSQPGRDSKEQQGSGLGLSIASYFVELNGGRIELSSPDDDRGGLLVRVELPLADS